MSVFITSDEQKVRVYTIATKMKEKELSVQFISACVEQALVFEGTHDLLVLWEEFENTEEQNEILADLQDEIDIAIETPKKPVKKPYIKFDDLEMIAKDVKKFKDAFRKVIDKHGGITKLAVQTGIPQSSLSRFFNSTSMPRRTTLYKIAEALNLSEAEISIEWVA